MFSALVVAQGLTLAAVGLSISSVNLPRAPQRIGHEVVVTLGLAVAVLGLLSLRLPVKATMAFGSSLPAVMVVFGAGYRPLRRGDLVLTLVSGSVSYRTYESETEWAERYGRTDLRLGRRGIPNATARQVSRDFTVTYRLDGEGWRRLPAPAPGSAAGDVWFLGCSYTFGVGVEDDEVYVHRLAVTAWPHLQVRNFSVPAWGTTNAYLALEDQLSHQPTPRAASRCVSHASFKGQQSTCGMVRSSKRASTARRPSALIGTRSGEYSMQPKYGRTFMGIVVGCLVVAFGVPLLAQSNMGTWTLNVAKSTYSPNTPPKSSTLTIATTGVTVDVALPTGAQHWTYGGTYDGKPVPITGNPNADTASRKRLSPTTTETTFTKAGKVTSVNTAVVAADGKTMTITAKGITAEGQPMLNVQLYEKK